MESGKMVRSMGMGVISLEVEIGMKGRGCKVDEKGKVCMFGRIKRGMRGSGRMIR